MSTANMPSPGQPKPPILAGPRGLQLTSLDEYYRFSQYVAASRLAPRGLDSPEAILVALEYGAELGLSPMQSLQAVAVVNGRPALWGDTMLAVCMASDLWDSEVFCEAFEGQPGTDEFRAVCTVGRRGRHQPVTRSFSIGQAKRAGLWGKQGPWQQYPERMLQMRARSWALRDAFPDVLRGTVAAEELVDVQGDNAGAKPAKGVAGLAGALGVDASATPAPREAAEEDRLAEAAAGEAAAGPNGTTPEAGAEGVWLDTSESQLADNPPRASAPLKRKGRRGAQLFDTTASATEAGL